MTPVFYAINELGHPQLSTLPTAAAAIVVPHYFGRTTSLAAERRWCDLHGIALIEDCAHAFFGMAGERPVGAWGDYAIASATKFFPATEAGLLISHRYDVTHLRLQAPSSLQQLKAGGQILSLAAAHKRLAGLSAPLRWASALAGRSAWPEKRHAAATPTDEVADLLQGCDMSRRQQQPLWLARQLVGSLPRRRIVQNRRRNATMIADAVSEVTGARLLFAQDQATVPYAVPVFVEDAERVYHELRRRGLAIFRWDQAWRGADPIPGDVGHLWRHHVLQVLCHQDMSQSDLDGLCSALRDLLPSAIS